MTRSKRGFGTLVGCVLIAAGAQVALGAGQTVGLFQNDPSSAQGYTLMSPLNYTKTYLLDMNGRPVNVWSTPYKAGLIGYLQPDGHLLRAGSDPSVFGANFGGNAGGGGRIEEYDWDGNLVWSFIYSDNTHLQHHDITKLPNGNVLLIAWEFKTSADAIAAGRNTSHLLDGKLWPDTIVEIQPILPTGGTIVWKWSYWDHLIQDFDSSKANYGVVADHPELINLNPPDDDGHTDVTHCNGIDYNPQFDQIILSSHRYSEFWVLDHSTTTAEAAGHTGGHYGHGGDVLYRWGNPENYHRGTNADQQIYNGHDSHWIKPGLPGAGHILEFNNGPTRPGGPYSTILEIVPPNNPDGSFPPLAPGVPYGPASPVWTYTGTPPSSFYSAIISGADRQTNGDTVICSGVQGLVFEVTNPGATVWKYINPVGPTGPIPQGQTPVGQNDSVFKVRRYPPDYPAFIGRTLVPGNPIEVFTAPAPVPDGRFGSSPVTASRLTPAGDQIQVAWDATSCPAVGYKLFYGNLATVSTLAASGSRCGIGTSGSYTWTSVPSGSLWFLLAGTDATGIYESSWGKDSTGAEENGSTSSFTCGTTTKADSLSCP